MNVGVFGGTFDPVHLGHLRVAEEAREALGLDRVVFVPSRIPPHKMAAEIAPPELRLEMVRRAVESNPYFEVSELEIAREGPSYSVVTLRELRRGLAPGDRLWFLLGEDAFRDIHTWHCFSELFEQADIAVLRRPPPSGPIEPPASLAWEFAPSEAGFRHRSGREVRFVPVTLLDISSTRIRRALEEGQSVRYLVPDAVLSCLTPELLTPSRKGAHD
ncbi:MAG: nicotinate (nicotinamide) nucleotide adenylyltransferase [Deltaproteobacteria bacterium]|nr:nicotinate (nicotinamide) nucleotide adenylyltransferase [Deltaproteobacteria bacterium]